MCSYFVPEVETMLQYLECYTSTHLESAINEFYRKHHIRSPQDIDLELFAYDAGVWVHYIPASSTSYEFKQGYTVIVDNRLPWEQQRVELAHELGHVLLHCGRQEFMPDEWRAAQELQADKFALYALAPTCMLANYLTSATTRYELAHQLAYQFDVPEPFMDVRLQLLEQRLQDITVRQELSRVVAEHRATYDYSYRHPTNPRIEYLVKNNRVVGKRQRADI